MMERCAKIANTVCGGPPQKCYGVNADKWQAAWDAACIAFGGDPEDYKFTPNIGDVIDCSGVKGLPFDEYRIVGDAS